MPHVRPDLETPLPQQTSGPPGRKWHSVPPHFPQDAGQQFKPSRMPDAHSRSWFDLVAAAVVVVVAAAVVVVVVDVVVVVVVVLVIIVVVVLVIVVVVVAAATLQVVPCQPLSHLHLKLSPMSEQPPCLHTVGNL